MGDMWSVYGDDAAVQASVYKGWNKIRQLEPLLIINKDVPLLMRGGKLYTAVKRGQ